MATVNISLSDELKSYVDAQIKGGAYGNVSEFFRSLIREHQSQAAQTRLESFLLEGLESGSAGPMTGSDWKELRRVALERARRRGKKSGAQESKISKNAPSPERPGRNRGLLR